MLFCGVEVYGKIFIVGGNKGVFVDICEVYNE